MSKFYELKVTEEFGRGMYATRDIAADTVIGRYEILAFSQEDTNLVMKTGLYFYTFALTPEGRECLVLGDGEMFNHSDEPNVDYLLIDFEGRKVMLYRTNRDVSTGEQLFINYDADKRFHGEFDSKAYVGRNLMESA